MRLSNDTNKYGPDFTQNVAPSDPWAGCLWFDTTTNLLKVWTGAYWRWNGAELISGGDLGYSIGGSNSVSMVSLVERIAMPFDGGIATIVGFNNSGRASYAGGYFNSSKYGYVIAGQEPAGVIGSFIHKLQFPFDSGITSFIGNTETTRGSFGGFNSSNAGYCSNGIVGSTAISYISKLLFATDTYTKITAYNTVATENFVGCNSSQHGFIFGGANNSSMSVLYSSIQRMIFSADTTNSTVVGVLSCSKLYGGCANSSIHGFAIGGYSGASISNIDRITFPFASGSVTAMTGLTIVNSLPGITGSPLACYIMGGSGVTTSQITKLTFPYEDGVQTYSGNLTSTRYGNVTPDNTDFVAMFV